MTIYFHSCFPGVRSSDVISGCGLSLFHDVWGIVRTLEGGMWKLVKAHLLSSPTANTGCLLGSSVLFHMTLSLWPESWILSVNSEKDREGGKQREREWVRMWTCHAEAILPSVAWPWNPYSLTSPCSVGQGDFKVTPEKGHRPHLPTVRINVTL